MSSLTEATISEVRAFNRFYTKVIGVLQAGVHQSPYSLTEGRVLYEVAHAEPMETGELRALLDLDAGYLSRVLAKLEGDGLIVRERSATDARKHVVRLSPAGREAFGALDRTSSEEVARLLAGLPEEGRDRLVAGMRAIRDVLGPPAGPRSCLIRPLRDGDLSWAVYRHGALYSQEYGWGREFEQTVARIAADYDPPRDTGWIAEVDGRRAGCVFYVRKDDTTGQLRMLLVEPFARGLGLGRLLVDECLRHARADGRERVVLWTRDCLTSARRIYQAAGFRLDSEEKGMENGIEVTEQMWSLDLTATG